MPFGFKDEYKDWDACVLDNQDKDNPDAYCGWLKNQTEKSSDKLMTMEKEYAKAGKYERKLLVKEAADIVVDSARNGHSFIPGDCEFPRAVFDYLRPYVCLSPVGKSVEPVFIWGYVGEDIVRDCESDIPDSWAVTLESMGWDGGFSTFDIPSYPVYDLVFSKSAMNKVAKRQCSYCRVASDMEMDVLVDGKFVRLQACDKHYKDVTQKMNVVRAKKNGLTTSSFGGAGQAPLTIEYGRSKKDELPDFLGGNPPKKKLRKNANRSMIKARMDGQHSILTKNEEMRYTFTVVYKPDDLDAHSEWASADGLFKALIEHVRTGDRSIYYQHGHVSEVGFKKAGEWVALAPWPYDVKASFINVNGKTEKRNVPANSIWMGIIWEPWAWEKVKTGEIRGLSFGGTSKRMKNGEYV